MDAVSLPCSVPEAAFTPVTLAPGRSAPVASVTVPEMEEVLFWAHSVRLLTNMSKKSKTAVLPRVGRICMYVLLKS